MNEKQLREKVVQIAEGWIGLNEKDKSFMEILNIYNGHKPLARGYAVKLKDHWCAATVSAVFIEAGLTDIAPTECSCAKMIDLYKKIGRWKESDSYVPVPGDVIMYDWEDDGVGDNTGTPNHVGIVASVSGGMIRVIEGNYSEKVAARNIKVNGKYIRGYCLPDYKSKAKEKQEQEDEEVVTKGEIKIDGKTSTVNRILKDGTNYVKIRDVAAIMGYDITAEKGVVIMTKKK